MSKKFVIVSVRVVALLTMACLPRAAVPPRAAKIPAKMTLHGDTRVDNYAWLRNKKDPEVEAYVEAENSYARKIMHAARDLEETMAREIFARVSTGNKRAPERYGAYEYYWTVTEQQQYSNLVRRAIGSKTEEIILDVNRIAKDQSFIHIGAYAVSPDGHYIAFTSDNTGQHHYTLRFKDLRTGKMLSESIARVGSLAWARDGNLYYAGTDNTTRSITLNRRTPRGERGVLYEEPDERFEVTVKPTASGDYVLAESASATTTEYRVISTDGSNLEPLVLAPRKQGVVYYVRHGGGEFLVLTNDRSDNFRLMVAPDDDPSPRNWRELVGVREGIMLDDVAAFRGHYAILERREGMRRIKIIDRTTRETRELDFPENVYNIGLNQSFSEEYPVRLNPQADTTTLRVRYESVLRPPHMLDFDMKTAARAVIGLPSTPGFNPDEYDTERIHATATDGARIPISVVSKKGTVRDGSAAMLLEGYGAYGVAYDPEFSTPVLSLLERGVTYAIAHVRGGGDLGKAWHEQGRMGNKMNSFTDFISAAAHLRREGYTSANRLVARGSSAGGLLVAGVANMAPSDFKAIVSNVPFVDVLTSMLDASMPLVTGEYEEWGNPNKPADYRWMKSYSPYDNVTAHDYPPLLLLAGWNDSRVGYWEAAKLVAKLRELKTDDNPLLLKTSMHGAHHGSSGRFDRAREQAFEWAFILWQLGMQP